MSLKSWSLFILLLASDTKWSIAPFQFSFLDTKFALFLLIWGRKLSYLFSYS
jgi:hypothetical protein